MFSLFATRVNGNVMFAYIMMFHCTSVCKDALLFGAYQRLIECIIIFGFAHRTHQLITHTLTTCRSIRITHNSTTCRSIRISISFHNAMPSTTTWSVGGCVWEGVFRGQGYQYQHRIYWLNKLN